LVLYKSKLKVLSPVSPAGIKILLGCTIALKQIQSNDDLS
jgi:hypothetical protein